MLKKIQYSVTFPTTGRTLSADVDFTHGFTAITGPNESGKSMIFEVMRWLLFGTDALRGKADDYKTLKASGEFVIKGNTIQIERTAKGATMTRNGTVVATGTRPVNGKVIEELGFGLAVFDITNAINQGEVERLGEMKPTARKAMLDSVLGLTGLDLVGKWAAEEARALDKQAEAIRERLTPAGPPPVKPEGYVHSNEISLQTANARAAELAEVNGWLAHTRARPEKPTTKVDLPAANLESLAGKRRAARESVETLRAKVNALPEKATFDASLLDQVEAAWTAWHAYDTEARWATLNPKLEFTAEDLDQAKKEWDQIDERDAWRAQVKEVERLRAALEGVEKIDCPSCGHNFALHAEHAARLKAELEVAEQGASDLKPEFEGPLETPLIRKDQIGMLRAALEGYDHDRRAAFEAMTAPVKPELAEREIPTFRRQIEQAGERAVLSKELEIAERTFADMVDYETMLVERRQYETALASWQTASVEYETWLKEREQKMQRQAALKGADEERDRLTLVWQEARTYEAALTRHAEIAEAYATGVKAVAEIEETADEHRKVREVMAILRGLIKQHVVPSLNVVASQLLRQMTGGQRNLIQVDEDFDIMVDGQALDTLSGSGKAVANLSLRIALGQVLTNRVFSIMLADEIDASMDEFRSEQTADVLRMLEERVSQVLLVSHKAVDAPHHVRLGGLSDDDHYAGAGA